MSSKANGATVKYDADGRRIRVFLFMRLSPIDRRPILWQVEGLNVDHALRRLCDVEHWIEKSEWDLVQELDLEHDVGAMGRKLPIEITNPRFAIIAGLIRPLFSRLKH